MYQQQLVGDAIARAIGTLDRRQTLGWASSASWRMPHEAADYLEEMRNAVGISTAHKELASTIAYSLYKWLTPGSLLLGFSEVITPHLAACGLADRPAAPRFLLMLAGRPGFLADWDEEESAFLLDCIIRSPSCTGPRASRCSAREPSTTPTAWKGASDVAQPADRRIRGRSRGRDAGSGPRQPWISLRSRL